VLRETYRRRTARVLLLDNADRLLLFRGYRNSDEPARGYCWWTPGGGVDKGESLLQAAVRELREETGLVVEPEKLGEVIAETSGYADLGWAKGVFRDDFFFLRVDKHDVDTSGFEELERAQITAHRWWTLDELAAPSDPVYPLEVEPLLKALAAGRIPAEPVRLPWHH
jgi:8-oxo-dGTP pyrophosphatase MutT (NUDIX family)